MPPDHPPIPVRLSAASPADPTVDAAAAYARLSLAPATLRAYRADWDDFLAWCRACSRRASAPWGRGCGTIWIARKWRKQVKAARIVALGIR